MTNFTTCKLSEGEALYQKGDPSDKFYFLLHGTVHYLEHEGENKPLKVLEEGQFFGFRSDPTLLRNEIITAKTS